MGEVADLLDAFWRLDRDRPYVGMSAEPAPIPYSSIVKFAESRGICGDEFEAFFASMRVLDNTRVERIHASRAEGEPLPEAGPGMFGPPSDRPLTPSLFGALFEGETKPTGGKRVEKHTYRGTTLVKKEVL